MKKAEHLMQEAVDRERAILIYVSHIRVVLRWAGVSRLRRRAITETLGVIKKESAEHVTLLKELKNYV